MQALGGANAYLCAVRLDPDNNTETLTMIEKKRGLPKPQTRLVPIVELTTDEATFQPRFGGLRSDHVARLADSLRRGAELDPPEVWQNPETGVLVVADGHHRLAAHREIYPGGKTRVRVYRCELKDAMVLPMLENVKDRLPLTYEEKATQAWQRVCAADWSKREIKQRCGVSDGTVARMRRIKLGLQEREEELPKNWREAQDLHDGKEPREWSASRREEWIREQTEKAERAFGGKLADLIRRCPSAAGTLIEKCAGGKLEGMLDEIGYVPHDFEAEFLGGADANKTDCPF